jgi:hypothetical protein
MEELLTNNFEIGGSNPAFGTRRKKMTISVLVKPKTVKPKTQHGV